MKKILIGLLLICSSFVACTDPHAATTYVNCPCVIKEIELIENSNYYVYSYSIEDEYEYFGFYTTYHHQIGDTIK